LLVDHARRRLSPETAQLTFSQGSIMTTQTGIVKWFNDAKGFGFITPDAGGGDLFVHFQDIQANGFKSLTDNQRVSFERSPSPKGEKATNVRPS